MKALNEKLLLALAVAWERAVKRGDFRRMIKTEVAAGKQGPDFYKAWAAME